MSSKTTTFNVGVNPSSVAICGKYAYITNSNNYGITGSDTVTVLSSSVPLTTISDPSFNQPYRIAIDYKERYAYVCNSGSPSATGTFGTLSIIDLKSNTVVNTIPGFDGPGAIVLTKHYAYVTNYGAAAGVGSGNGNTVSVVDLKTRNIIATITTSLAPSALRLSKCHKYLYVTCYVDGNPGTGKLDIIDTKTQTVISTIGGLFGPFDLDLTKDGRYAYVTNFGSNNFAPYGTSVAVIDLKRQKIISEIEVGIQPAAILIVVDIAYVTVYNALYAGSNYSDLTFGQGTLIAIDTKTRKIIGSAQKLGQGPSGLALSKGEHGNYLYCTQYPLNTVTKIRLA